MRSESGPFRRRCAHPSESPLSISRFAIRQKAAGMLLAMDLVDELLLLVHPILLGHGKRPFGDRTQATAFRLQASKASSTGVLANRYVREGEVRTGSFE